MYQNKKSFTVWFTSLSDDEKKQVIENKICFYLSRREYSKYELKQKLKQKYGIEYEDVIEDILAIFESKGWQSDERFAETFIRSKVNKGYGANKIKFDLKSKGVEVEKSLNSIEKVDFIEIAENEVRKKYGRLFVGWEGFDFDEKNKVKQKIYRFLQYRGLPIIDIESLIENK